MDYSSDIDKVETTIHIFNLLLENKKWTTINDQPYHYNIDLPISDKLVDIMGYVHTHLY